MKLTESQLRNIIRESVKNILKEELGNHDEGLLDSMIQDKNSYSPEELIKIYEKIIQEQPDNPNNDLYRETIKVLQNKI